MGFSGKRLGYLLLGSALLLAALVIYLNRNKSRTEPGPTSSAVPAMESSDPRQSPRQAASQAPADPSPGVAASTDAAILKLIRTSLEDFKASNGDPEKARGILKRLRDGIRAASEEDAAAEIIQFLQTGEDAPTGLPFVVGPDGVMDTVPTVRTALLDLLASLDPVAALTVARELMEKRTTPDEYALSLRNLAWNDLDGDLRNELTGRFLDLLNTPWLDQPSAGFLESFDIAVEVGGRVVFDKLLALTKETAASKNGITQAAFMSLDRMILRDPSLLTTAVADPAWMNSAPMQRASLVSRLDLSLPAQRDAFVRYLSSPHTAEELDYFAKVFPNRNYLYGNRLVTADDATPSITEVAAADAKVLEQLTALTPSLSASSTAVIEKIRARLQKMAPR